MAFTVRTDPALERALDALSGAEGISRQEIVRRSVLERYERTVHVSRVTFWSGSALNERCRVPRH
jgi:predicted transcriptional regulator